MHCNDLELTTWDWNDPRMIKYIPVHSGVILFQFTSFQCHSSWTPVNSIPVFSNAPMKVLEEVGRKNLKYLYLFLAPIQVILFSN